MERATTDTEQLLPVLYVLHVTGQKQWQLINESMGGMGTFVDRGRVKWRLIRALG